MVNKSNRVGILTGASQGIGFAIANYLASQGYQLLLIARNHEKLTQAADQITKINPQIKLTIAAIDVSDYPAVKKHVTEFIENSSRIDFLCNNAGHVKRGSSELPHDEFIKMINTNLIGAFNLIHAVAPYMKKNNSGRIVNIVSRSGKVAQKHLGGYAASKFGLMGLNESIYKELAEYGIYVTAICPNLVSTEMTADVDMDKAQMLALDDIVKTIDYLLHLSPTVAIREIVMQCRAKLIEG